MYKKLLLVSLCAANDLAIPPHSSLLEKIPTAERTIVEDLLEGRYQEYPFFKKGVDEALAESSEEERIKKLKELSPTVSLFNRDREELSKKIYDFSVTIQNQDISDLFSLLDALIEPFYKELLQKIDNAGTIDKYIQRDEKLKYITGILIYYLIKEGISMKWSSNLINFAVQVYAIERPVDKIDALTLIADADTMETLEFFSWSGEEKPCKRP